MKTHSIPRQARDGEQSRTILALAIISLLVCTAAEAKYSGGSGEPNDPYQIADANNLLALAADTNDYNKCFILTTDVNMEGQVWTTAIIAADTTFTGTFDGNGHKITNFTINGGRNWYLGLFGYINSSGSVKNLGLENCSVSGYSSQYVGGLVGYVGNGSISNCYSTGEVCGGSNSYDVGGLVGWNCGSISNCYSTGAVSGSYEVGGLVGENYYSNISQCYSTGTVSGSSSVGGLVGYNYYSNISQCYSTGTVSGSSWRIGGLVGYNYGGNISNCYSTGAVSGSPISQYVGGLVGYNGGGSVISSFWDTETSGQTIGVGGGSSVGISGKTTAEMKTKSTFTDAGWDFVNIWNICEGTNYPKLRWQIPPIGDFICPDGVDFVDFAILASAWQTEPNDAGWNLICDISQPKDNVIDEHDLSVFCENWLEGTGPY
jgi:hypothetical protein